MKIKPSTEYAILGALANEPKHGYDIARFLESGLDATWYVSTSQLYTLLKKLERHGYLSSRVTPQETRPSKRMFSLTPKGQDVFLTWLRQPSEHVRDLRIEFLAKIFFFNHLGLKGGEALIDAQRRLLLKKKAALLEKRRRMNNSFQKLVFSSKTSTLDAWLDWLKKEAEPFLSKGIETHE